MEIVQVLGMAILCRSLTQIFKRIYNKQQKVFHIPEIISIGVGVLVSCLTNINMFSTLIPSTSPVVHWILVVLTGIIFGQGGSFVYDLWSSLQKVGVNIPSIPQDVLDAIETLKSIILTPPADDKKEQIGTGEKEQIGTQEENK